MRIFAVLVLIALFSAVLGCSVVEKCQPCVEDGCFFVTLSNGVICLDSVEGIVGVISIAQPFSPEFCEDFVTTTTTITTTTTATTTTIITTTEAPETGEIAWFWIVLFTIITFLLFFVVGYFLYNNTNINYKRHRDTLIKS